MKEKVHGKKALRWIEEEEKKEMGKLSGGVSYVHWLLGGDGCLGADVWQDLLDHTVYICTDYRKPIISQ